MEEKYLNIICLKTLGHQLDMKELYYPNPMAQEVSTRLESFKTWRNRLTRDHFLEVATALAKLAFLALLFKKARSKKPQKEARDKDLARTCTYLGTAE